MGCNSWLSYTKTRTFATNRTRALRPLWQLAPVVLTVVIVARIAEQPDSYISWGVFAALIVSGATTVLQAVRVGRLGAGHVLIMGTSGAFIAVCVAALVKGGPATMASLIVVSSLFQFALAARLSLLRRIFTPVVAGTVIMPIVFDSLTDVPDGSSQAAAPAAALATLVVVGPSCCAPHLHCGYGRLS